MSGEDTDPEAGRPEPTEADLRRLDLAAEQLRHRTDERWVEVSGRILRAALSTTRRGSPVRAESENGSILISTQVIVATLREALDGAVPGTALAGLHVALEGQDGFSGVLMDVTVQHGLPITDAADALHSIALETLGELLGPGVVDVVVRPTLVHVGDVVPRDPHSA